MRKSILNILPAAAGLILLTACGSNPEAEGEKAAEKTYQCEVSHANNLKTKVQDYINGFGKAGYTSRSQARAALLGVVQEADNQYIEDLQQVQQEYDDKAQEYTGDSDDLRKFRDSYDNKMLEYGDVDIDTAALWQQAIAQILTIIPPDPKKGQLKNDIAGCSWQDTPDGYFGTDPQKINKRDIQDIKVTKFEKNGNQIDIDAVITLQAQEGHIKYKIYAEITYVLGDGDDWILDNFYTEEVKVVKTENSKYFKYITQSNNGWLIQLSNNSDASLLVGGAVYDNNSGWKKYSVVVYPHDSYSFPFSVKECEVHFVERP